MIVYLDSLALLYRAYYAIPDLHAKSGVPTGALYGLSTMLFRIIDELSPDHIVACFDRPEQTFRQASELSYKATRELPEEEMITQIEAARDVLAAYGVHVVEKVGYEADDLLGTLALADSKRGEDVVIVTCDGDLLQLTVHKNIRVYLLQKSIRDFALYDEKKVEKKNGYLPKYIIDYKGLAGDSSDNIKGVSGIGAVFAKRLITSFGGLDDIYKALDLGKLPNAGFTKRIENLLVADRKSAFTSRDLATIHTDVPVRSPYIKSKQWKERIVLSDAREILTKYSFESLLSRLNTIVGNNEAVPTKESHEAEDPALLKAAAIALWVLDASQTNAKCETIYAYTNTSTLSDALREIEERLKKEGRLQVWKDIEQPLIPVIDSMEKMGICFDVSAALILGKKYHKILSSLVKKIHTLAGKEFNVNSPKQLSEVLYTDLGLQAKRVSKTSSGGRTTKESVLLDLIDAHPIIPLVLEYRHYEKIRSTYIDALPGFCDTNNRIHTHLQQNGTITGRLSSRDPNLQNIPIGGEDGKAVRDLFIATKGWSFVSIDYSQMELRLAAILSKDSALLEAFLEGDDVHRSVAVRVFSVSPDEVTAEQRAKAKTINFGILYGMGSQALRRLLDVPLSEADFFLNQYKKTFGVLFTYLDSIKQEALTSGFVTTAFGRVRPIDGANSSLAFVRAQAERMAVNTVVQGTAADIIKIAMIQINSFLEKEKLVDTVRPLLQIHDELLFEVYNPYAPETIKSITTIMESIYPDEGKPIQLTTNVKIGNSWGSLQSY